jgi:alcohol dehydrogenase (cytochrome c)
VSSASLSCCPRAGNPYRRCITLLLTGIAAVLLALRSGHAETTGQADQSGNALYLLHCAACHGPKLEGGFAPALSGNDFQQKWRGKAVGSLELLIARTMPPVAPASLAAEQYQQIARFLWRANGWKSPDPEGAAAAARAGSAEARQAAKPDDHGLGDGDENRDPTYVAVVERRARLLQALTDVSDKMLQHPAPGEWLHWRRTSDGLGFSPLDQINRKNVSRLRVAWSLSLADGSNGITPLVHDGILFINSSGTVTAVDGATGDPLWEFKRTASVSTGGPPISQPRSLAIYRNMLLVPTIDNHVIALDMRRGEPVWDREIAKSGGMLRLSAGPLVAGNKVIEGISGCAGLSQPDKCYVIALDAQTGDEAWRFYTVPRNDDEPAAISWNGASADQRSGASIWSSPTYDIENNLVLVGTGQSYHVAPIVKANGEVGPSNAALYTDSTLALDPDTGVLKWYYQHLTRDVWDLDWAFERQIVPIAGPAGARHAVATMGKLGILDLLEPVSGRYISSFDLGFQNLVIAIDPVSGRKRTDPLLDPTADGPKIICPDASGIRNWQATSYDPQTGLLYVPFTRSCMAYSWNKGREFDVGYRIRADGRAEGNYGGMAAIDIAGRKLAWIRHFRAPSSASALATAGKLVFGGSRDRVFRAYDALNGKTLWQLTLDNSPSSSPITFTVAGVQYVAVVTGGGSPSDAIVRPLTPEIGPRPGGIRLWVFTVGPSHPSD